MCDVPAASANVWRGRRSLLEQMPVEMAARLRLARGLEHPFGLGAAEFRRIGIGPGLALLTQALLADAVEVDGRLAHPFGPIMSSGRTIRSKVSPSTKPRLMA